MFRSCLFAATILIAVQALAEEKPSSPAKGQGPLDPSDHTRTLQVDGRTRSYIVHVPPKLDPKQPTPVVLAFHGAATNASIMALSSGLSDKADEAGFIVVYPNGTGKGDMFLVWNAGGWHGPKAEELPDDVKFVTALLDDLAKVVNVDPKRIYATGMSNGGMMCYRLAAELSNRIAAIAPVSGTMAVEKCHPRRPVPVMHFHGTDDKLVPFEGPDQRTAKVLAFKSVEETIRTWAKIDGCPSEAEDHQAAAQGRRRHERGTQDLWAGQGRGRGCFVRHPWRRSHLAGKEVARALARQDDQGHLGKRPDVGVLQATSDADTAACRCRFREYHEEDRGSGRCRNEGGDCHLHLPMSYWHRRCNAENQRWEVARESRAASAAQGTGVADHFQRQDQAHGVGPEPQRKSQAVGGRRGWKREEGGQ